MAFGSTGLLSGLRVPISRHHVEPEEPLDAFVELPGRGEGGFLGDETYFGDLDYTRRGRDFGC